MRLFAGVDVGTQGVRALVATSRGDVVASASRRFDISTTPYPGTHEQDTRHWWQAVKACLQEIVSMLHRQGASATDIAAICVDSTSGTILPISQNGEPLANAIMYNDARAAAEAETVNAVAMAHCEAHGYRFAPSYALAKILWMKRHQLALYESAWKIIHATDYITGKLTGNFGSTDFSSALKTGCDLLNERWPRFIEDELGISLSKLPELGPSGRVLGTVSPICAAETGLSTHTKVCAGMTDGTAGLLASGATEVGDFNSTLGTTLVIKGNWSRIVLDSAGRVYSHKHPAGWWLPGGASNVGGECLAVRFPGKDFRALDCAAMKRIPTDLVIYPLVREGERLPFMNSKATGFIAERHGTFVTLPCEEDVSYAAHLEGVAYVERMCYEVMESLGVKVNAQIYATGAATRSREWRTIRATVLTRTLAVPQHPESAFGACVLAASSQVYEDLPSAIKGMVRIVERTEPQPRWINAYHERYEIFKKICKQKGYIE